MGERFDPDKTILGENEESDREKLLDRISELENQRNGMLAFRDVIPADRTLLEKIDAEIKQLKKEYIEKEAVYFEKEKEMLFITVDRMGGAYSSTYDRNYSPEETKELIEKVLENSKGINEVPRSPIFGTTENLRDKVQKLLNIETKKQDAEKAL